MRGLLGSSSWPGRSLELLMEKPAVVAKPCRECGWSPVEVLKRIRSGLYLWCPKCRAIWLDPWLTP